MQRVLPKPDVAFFGGDRERAVPGTVEDPTADHEAEAIFSAHADDSAEQQREATLDASQDAAPKRLAVPRYPGWASRVSLDHLDISDCTACVLGQLFGVYFGGLRQVGIDEDEAVAYGFHPRLHEDAYVMHADCDSLTEAWLDEIRARRAQSRWMDGVERHLMASRQAGVA